MINQVLLVVYVAVIVALSIRLRQGTFSGFVISDRNVMYPAVIGIAFTAAYFSAASFLGGGGYGLIAGFPWVIWATLMHVAFACLAWIMAPKIWAMAKSYDAKTVPQLLERRYGSPGGRVLLAVIMLVMYTVYLIAIFKGCAHLFEGLLGISYIQGLLVAVVIVAIYYAVGGLPAILWISFIQGIIMLGGAALLYAALLYAGGGTEIWANIPAAVTSMSGDLVPWQTTVGTAFSISLGLLALPDLLIMIFSARDKRVVKFAGIYSPIAVSVYALAIFSIGVLAYGVFSAEELAPFIKNPDSLVPFVATSLLPPGFDAIILLAAISAAMSTISAIVLVTTTSLTADTLRFLRPDIPDDRVLVLTRVVGLLIIAVSALMARNVPELIVPLVSLSMGVIACCVFIPLIFGIYWDRGTSAGFVSGLVATFVSIVAWNFYGNPLIHPVMVGVVVGTAAYLATSLVTKPPDSAQIISVGGGKE
ncbi:MAG: sodium:solute symporter family protein [Methanothrix sp.]|jgi:sodium/pantothenate symporter|nr:sodium:solute symporter family protein [Methanothrix sp.]HNT72123.1 sodium:solute symporter family protein [Methanothrix sp.]HOI69076.1 sodium:solute symporter family protein [Methanothrix sp.]HPY72932.1 sodium:solute symporter family protein [Methanothrix sp.]HQA62380.1 sodium:solute symporter family protein [Methanothrix sp.]